MQGGKVMDLTKVKRKSNISILIFSIIVVLLLALSANIFAANPSSEEMRNKLWAHGGITTVTTSDTLTANALMHYGRNGVFGYACQTTLKSYGNANLTLNQVLTAGGCSDLAKFYQDARKYGDIVDARTKIADPNNKRLDAALTEMNKLTQVVFSYMIVFGELTAILVFIIMFMQMAWMPSHAFQKRKLFVDIATAGASIILLGNIWLVISLFQASFNRFWQTFAVYSTDWKSVAAMVLVEYKGFIVGLSGIATLLVLGMFVVNFIGLATNAGQANKRSEKISSLLNCGIAAAGLGSVTLIVGVFWNMLG